MLRERRYPTNSEGLGALVPDLLPAVPKDPWAIRLSIDMMEQVCQAFTRRDQTDAMSTAAVMMSASHSTEQERMMLLEESDWQSVASVLDPGVARSLAELLEAELISVRVIPDSGSPVQCWTVLVPEEQLRRR